MEVLQGDEVDLLSFLLAEMSLLLLQVWIGADLEHVSQGCC